MSKEDLITIVGTVIEVCPSGMFRVQLDNGHVILAHLAGKLRINNINVNNLDTVTVEMSPYDLEKGRIIFRQRNKSTPTQPSKK